MTWTLDQVREPDDRNAKNSRDRRAERREAGICINGQAKATHGCRCHRCYLVHKHGARLAYEMTEYEAAPLCASSRRIKAASTEVQS